MSPLRTEGGRQVFQHAHLGIGSAVCGADVQRRYLTTRLFGMSCPACYRWATHVVERAVCERRRGLRGDPVDREVEPSGRATPTLRRRSTVAG